MPETLWLLVTDNGLKSLSPLKFISYLNLSGTKITDRGLKDLYPLKTLKEIYLWGSEVSENGVKDLRSALPDAKILF